jgi:hypothetical protein
MLVALACGVPPGDPIAPALGAFDAAQRRDARGVQAYLDVEAIALANDACPNRLAINCLTRGYHRAGVDQFFLRSREGVLVASPSRDDDDDFVANVRVRSVWTSATTREVSGIKELCQTFKLAYSRGWRVRNFWDAAPCSN